MEWGEVSKADLAMTSYAPDTSAPALILCDYGVQKLSDDLGLNFTRHVRIKIFSAAGFSWGSQAVDLYTKDNTQRINGIEGITYTFGKDSSIVKTELESSSIFEEKVDDERTRIRFSLPGLLPGCIVDIKYTIASSGLSQTEDWEFQHAIPTRWSEFRFLSPKQIIFGGALQGYEPWAVNERTDVKMHIYGDAASYIGQSMPDAAQFRWAVKDAPAMRTEPYITTMGDYINKVNIQLAGYALRTGGSRRVLQTWAEVVEELRKSKQFGEMCDPASDVRKLAEKTTAGMTAPDEKIQALYNLVRNTIVWDGKHRLWAQQDGEEVLESRKGNSSEMALLLVAMLRAAGVEANPVVVSTRSHGRIQMVYPIAYQFNHVLVQAKGNAIVYLDPTDHLRPWDMLPTDVLNVRGLVIKEGPEEWVTITTILKAIHRALATIAVSPAGEISGTLQNLEEGYGALTRRRELHDKSDMNVAKDVFDADKSGLTLDSLQVTGKDSITGPLKITAKVSSSTYAQAAGDFIYINPHVIDRIAENPFKIPERKYPVDMAYCRVFTTVITVKIPEGYDVKEVPPDVQTALGADEISFVRRALTLDNELQFLIRYSTSKTEFPSTEYRRLRDLFHQVVTAESGQIVLQRHAQPQAAPAKGVKPKPTPKKKGK